MPGLMGKRVHWRRAESGQAAVETALTLPLTLFLLLGLLQLSMMLQARIVAQYAAYQAVRAGSLNKGDCRKMQQAALVSLLPTLAQVHDPATLATAFGSRCSPCDAAGPGKVSVHYNPRLDVEGSNPGYDEQIVEIYREQPTPQSVAGRPNGEDTDFDEPRDAAQTVRLEIRMLYWYRMRIPFVNWVMSRMYLAYFGLKDYTAQNPLMETQTADWTKTGSTLDTSTWPGGSPGANMRKWALRRHHYLFPIKVTATMRMMTPAKRTYFASRGCPL